MKRVLLDIYILDSKIVRTVYKDRDNDKRWDLSKLPDFDNRGNDPFSQFEVIGFKTTSEKFFSFAMSDFSTNETIFDTSKRSLLLSDKYLEMGVILPSQILFGLGEHDSEFLLKEGNWTLFNRDRSPSKLINGDNTQRSFGTHPFIMAKTKSHKFVGMLFYNSNAQEINIRFVADGRSMITYRTTGGMLDIYYFTAGTADEVMKNYYSIVGTPSLPPFWALGFHQGSAQYKSTSDMRDVVKNYADNGYMLESIWADVAYMHNNIDFSVNQTSFGDAKAFVNELHNSNMHFVPVINSGVSVNEDSKKTNWFNIGQAQDIFIKSSKNPESFSGTLIGRSFSDYTVYVDYFNPKATDFWSQGLSYLHDQIPFDGIWLNNNVPSNDCLDSMKKPIGECPPVDPVMNLTRNLESADSSSHQGLSSKSGEYDSLPYNPRVVPLETDTISMDAYHFDPSENGTFVEYNTHNLFATMETKATAEFLREGALNKRTLVMSRDSFVGHGKYGFVWTGENKATVDDLKLSRNQIMRFNMFGIPFVGADVCGYEGKSTPELCVRWVQVAAFYPFMRNYYGLNGSPHELYTFDEKYQTTLRNAISQRYSLLKYIYTTLLQSSLSGTPTIRHLMYDYPELDEMVKNEDSFMLGKNLRITANYDVTPTPVGLKAKFPKGIWVDFNTYNTLKITEKVQDVPLYSGCHYTNIHIKGGAVIPVQNTGEGTGVKTSKDLLDINVNFIIVPNEGGYASGEFFNARGETNDEPTQYYSITHSNSRVIQFKRNWGEANVDIKVGQIHIVGDEDAVNADFICAKNQDYTTSDMKLESALFPISAAPYLKITSVDGSPILMNKILAIYYGKVGVDYNYCDKRYEATKDQESQYEQVYKLSKPTPANDEPTIILTAKLLSDNTVQVKITDDSGKRFEVPRTSLNPGAYPNPPVDKNINDFVTVNTDKFSLTVHEYQKPANVYFRIDEEDLVFTDYYLSMNSHINTDTHLYGLGERVTDFFVKEGIYTTWARDIPDPIDDGKKPGKNIYGTHPVYFTRSKTGSKFHWGMLNLNANAQDTQVKYTGDLGGEINHYITGQGIFDLYFFIDHKEPESMIKNFHELIGHSLLPPFWSVGWNQCRYGYRNTQELQDVYDGYENSNFPLDNLWSDIDYMYKYRDFTYDKNGSYAGLYEFVENVLHKNNKHYVPIIDAGMAIVKDGSYPSYDKGLAANAYIMSGNAPQGSSKAEDVFVGKVWPGYAAYPDFTNPKTNEWWTQELQTFHDKELPFDGLWLDMNEASNFCGGPCLDKDIVPTDISVKKMLIYTPGDNDLEGQSLQLDAKHSDGQTELNYHSLFGFLQGIPSYNYFVNNNKRPFIISRSTFIGQGKYTSHWLGDNFSNYDYLKYSIPGIFSMNLFGINFVGPDICGFINDTNEKLCERWTVLGAFYPFARNHNAIGQIDQEPYRWSQTTQDHMRNALRWRYALMRYYYTQMYVNSIEGGTFWKPLFFEFPDDTKVYDNVNKNIMIGSALKLSPMIDDTSDLTQAFIFPAGNWCSIVSNTCVKYTSTSTTVSLPTTGDAINLHLRNGYIIPIQKDALAGVKSSADLEQMHTSLLINMELTSLSATGRLMIDDGETFANPKRLDIVFDFLEKDNTHATLTFNKKSSDYQSEATKLGKIQILGADRTYVFQLLKADVNGNKYTGKYDSGTKVVTYDFGGIEMGEIDQISFST